VRGDLALDGHVTRLEREHPQPRSAHCGRRDVEGGVADQLGHPGAELAQPEGLAGRRQQPLRHGISPRGELVQLVVGRRLVVHGGLLPDCFKKKSCQRAG
jgi:hypothetical protein